MGNYLVGDRSIQESSGLFLSLFVELKWSKATAIRESKIKTAHVWAVLLLFRGKFFKSFDVSFDTLETCFEEYRIAHINADRFEDVFRGV